MDKERTGMLDIQTGKKLGLIAGYGEMPVHIARFAKQQNLEVYCVALREMACDEWKNIATEAIYVNLGEIQKTVNFFCSHQIKEITFAGKVDKKRLLNRQMDMDPVAVSFLSSLSGGNDDQILLGLVRLFAGFGIRVTDSTLFLRQMMPGSSCFQTRFPTKQELLDIRYGFTLAKEMGRLDIGQTVIVKNGSVLAIEALEGTDQAILRSGSLSCGGVVVKVSKPSQDLRFDVPTIGQDTLHACIQAKSSVLAFEANATIVLDLEKMIMLANEHNMSLYALEGE